MIVRKIVVGLILGAALVFAGQAAADSLSKVGKRVQAEYPVIVDGVTLNVKALAIDGTTTTPNRALAEAIGYDIAFVNKKVVYTKKVEEVRPVDEEEIIEEPVAPPEVPAPVDEPEPEPEYTLETVNNVIDGINRELVVTRMNLEIVETKNYPQSDVDRIKAAVQELEEQLVKMEEIKAALEAKK